MLKSRVWVPCARGGWQGTAAVLSRTSRCPHGRGVPSAARPRSQNEPQPEPPPAPRRAPCCPAPTDSLSRVPVPLPGLCALSINHANSYLAYPGSATSGEIVLYDGNTLVSAKLSLWIPAGAENKQSHSKANGALGKDE